MDSRWSPCGLHMDFKQNCSWRSFQDGVQVDLWSPCGVHVESVGEGKVQIMSILLPLFHGYKMCAGA